jgi:hypothetical protein
MEYETYVTRWRAGGDMNLDELLFSALAAPLD